VKKKVLITGGSGLLALNWAIEMRNKYDIYLSLHSRKIHLAGVVTVSVILDSEISILMALDKIQPDLIIHAAGFTNVDSCEKFPKIAYQTNVVLTENVANAAIKRNIKLVHISTDHLFNGKQGMMTESDECCPLNKYAETKLEAEFMVQSCNPTALIVRTNFYGWGTSYRSSFSDMVIKSLKSQKTVVLFQDVFYSPVIVSSLAETVHKLVNLNSCGIYNIVSDDSISKYEFGLKLAEIFNLNHKLIIPGKLSDNQDFVKRPEIMTLSNKKLCSRIGGSIGSVDEHIQLLYRQSKQNIDKELLSI